VTAPADRRGRAAARLKVSPALDAAIRDEARAAAREEVRMRWRSIEAGELATRQSAGRTVWAGVSRAHQELQNSSLSALTPREEAAVLLRVVETAWREGGPARARAVLDVCFRGESQISHALVMALQEETSEHQGPTEGHGRGNAEAGGEARGRAEAGGAAGTPLAAEQPNVGTRPAPGASAGTGAPAPSAPAPESGIERPVQAPDAESRAGLVRSPAPRAAGAEAPVTRETGAAAQRRELPFTGGDVGLIVLAGAAALAAGALLRRSARAVR
jgi:hypothetical protein